MKVQPAQKSRMHDGDNSDCIQTAEMMWLLAAGRYDGETAVAIEQPCPTDAVMKASMPCYVHM